MIVNSASTDRLEMLKALLNAIRSQFCVTVHSRRGPALITSADIKYPNQPPY